MIERPYWLNRIELAWTKAPIVWLSGVRRVGKTTLVQSISDGLYFNCDLPRVAEELSDPEYFFLNIKKQYEQKCLIFDEVHQLRDPSRVLKIAADQFPELRVLATGSSTLAATQKFKDSLTGRKRLVHMLPVLASELELFSAGNIKKRLLLGGLPQNLLSPEFDQESYSEWLDSFYARDIQELFRVEKRSGFLKLLELILRQSGSSLDITNLAKMAGLTRPTVMHYLEILQITHAITLLRPFAAGGRREIVAQAKVYGFDTGIVSYCKGWTDLRPEDCGLLYEHLVLETLQAMEDKLNIHYWRDKQQREIDFVLAKSRSVYDIIECKWNADSFEAKAFTAFREYYPSGSNIICSPQVSNVYKKKIAGFECIFVNAKDLALVLKNKV